MITPMPFIVALAVALMSSSASSFQLHPLTTITSLRPNTSSSTLSFPTLYNEDPKKAYSDLEGFGDDDAFVGEKFEGTVDWDAEWKKVVENRDQPAKRPGKYKSQVEIAAIKTTNKVAKNVYDASREMKESLPKPPSIRSLQGDWRGWSLLVRVVVYSLPHGA
ncbi:hypothetical protein ACHAXS_009134 [Conticribra weissflogii]